MNIFVLSLDPVEAAQMMCNKHIVKMVVESAQLLCTASALRGIDVPYKPTHGGHPCAKWTSLSPHNQSWLQDHFDALCTEYTNRYGRVHKTEHVIREHRSRLFLSGDHKQATAFAQAMPDEFRVPGDPVSAYRRYYISAKARFARWAPRASAPSWWPFKDPP